MGFDLMADKPKFKIFIYLIDDAQFCNEIRVEDEIEAYIQSSSAKPQ